MSMICFSTIFTTVFALLTHLYWNQLHPFYRIYSFSRENQLHPFPMSNIPLYKGVFKSFPDKNDVFFRVFFTDIMLYRWFRMSLICFFTIFHNCICSANSSLLKSAPSFLSHIFHFPKKISSVFFRWATHLYIKVYFKSFLEKMMLFLVFFHRYHALSMIQNKSDLLLHDIS